MIHFVFFLLVSFLQLFQSEAIRSDLELYPIFETTNGFIQGSKILSAQGNPFYAFRGIPFAKPPIGKLRFKPPLPYGKWNGTLDATDFGPPCTQPSPFFGMEGQEDCLWLNIFTPKMNDSTANLPVALFLYPGAYEMGDGGFPLISSPWSLMDHDIIFITCNARLAVLGFLFTDDSASPGNYHLLDYILAIKWIKQNIQDYGGNPNRVILWGTSSGAITIMHLLSSPLTKGLIQGVIAESGNSITTGLLTTKPSYTYKLAKMLHCPQNNTHEMVDCLRNKTANELQNIGVRKLEKQFFFFYGSSIPVRFSPTIDIAAGPEAVIPQHPLTLLQEAKFHHGVPILTGITRGEACLYYPWILASNPDFRSKFNEKYLEKKVRLVLDDATTTESFNELFRFYFNDTDLTNETDFQISFTNFFSDVFYKSPHDLGVRLLSRYNPVYNYLLDYVLNKEDKVPCTPHVMEMFFILDPFLFPERMQKMIKQILSYWINFIKYGNPTPDGVEPKWEPVKPNTQKLNYFRMSQEFSMFSGYREQPFRICHKYLYNYTLIEPETPEDQLPISSKRHFDNQKKQSSNMLILTISVVTFLLCTVIFIIYRNEKISTD